MPDTLTDDERALLATEAQLWLHWGAKEIAVRERHGCSLAVYYSRVARLVDRPAALAHDSVLVHRLLRQRGERARVRSSRRIA